MTTTTRADLALVGRTVRAVTVEEEDGERFLVLWFTDGGTVAVFKDEEGNPGGALHVLGSEAPEHTVILSVDTLSPRPVLRDGKPREFRR